MQLQLSTKKNLFVFFSYGISLNIWDKKKIFTRETNYYKLLSKNFNITFLTYGDKSDLKFSKKLKSIKILPLFKYIKKNIFTKYLVFLIGPIILRSELSKADLIKTHQITGGLMGLICSVFFRKKLVVRAGWEPTYNSKKWDIGTLKTIFLTINSFLSYQFSDKIIVTTQEIKNFITKKYFIKNKKITIIPNGISTSIFRKIYKERFKDKIISISRLEKQKNLFDLIDVCKLTNLKIDIIGQGSEKNNLLNYAKKKKVKINFLGNVDNYKIPKILSKYLFYLTTSKAEGSPKSILEAMACELVIFGLKVQGIENIIKNNINGFLFKNKTQLSEKINSIKKNYFLLNKLGKNNRKKIQKYFLVQNCVIKEKNIYYSL
tara:strand:+ start:470 stop:1597 length:1128 start_codon:yes stop_codon:yes gene_type:complete